MKSPDDLLTDSEIAAKTGKSPRWFADRRRTLKGSVRALKRWHWPTFIAGQTLGHNDNKKT